MRHGQQISATRSSLHGPRWPCQLLTSKRCIRQPPGHTRPKHASHKRVHQQLKQPPKPARHTQTADQTRRYARPMRQQQPNPVDFSHARELSPHRRSTS